MTEKQQGKDNEGKGGAVVQPGFPREPKAYAVEILRVVDLNQSRQNRVGGGQHRAEQQRHGPRHIQQVMGGQAHAQNAGEHHRSCQQVGRMPGFTMQLQAQFDAGVEQREQHRDFSQAFQPVAGVADIQLHQVQAPRADTGAERQTHRRGRDRQPAQ
nr:hypothetical protein [Tanacetum cinerariifolium]